MSDIEAVHVEATYIQAAFLEDAHAGTALVEAAQVESSSRPTYPFYSTLNQSKFEIRLLRLLTALFKRKPNYLSSPPYWDLGGGARIIQRIILCLRRPK